MNLITRIGAFTQKKNVSVSAMGNLAGDEGEAALDQVEQRVV